MMWFSHAALLLLLVFVRPALSRDGPPPDGTGNLASPCAATCVNNVFSSAEKFGCAVGDTICVCEKAPDFENGIKDCVVQACIGPLGESQDQITHAQDHGADVCNDAYWDAGILPWPDQPAQTPPEQTSPPAEASPTQASEAPPAPEATTTSAAPSTDAETLTTPEPAPESSASAPSTPPGAESASSQSSSSASAEITAAGETTLATKTSMSSSATASKSGAAATNVSSNSDEDKDDDPKPEGQRLSNKIIAVIVGVSVFVVLAAFAAALTMWCRKRRAKNTPPPLDISQPLPGSGRQFASGDELSQEKGGDQTFPAAYSSPASTAGSLARSQLAVDPTQHPRSSYSSELDREARRYEDMPPRAQPRMMI